MKVLAVGDTHGNEAAMSAVKRKAQKADILVCLGDFTFFGHDTKKHLADIASIGKPTLIIHGNHEHEDVLEGIEKIYPNMINLHRKVVSFGHIRFIGYGGGGFAKRNTRFERFSQKVARQLDKHDVAVLVTHGPPHDTELDYIFYLSKE